MDHKRHLRRRSGKWSTWCDSLCYNIGNPLKTEENSKTGKGAQCSRSESVLWFDSYGTPISFNHADGSSEYRTLIGSCLGFFVALLTLTFLANNLTVMANHKGSVMTTTTLESHFTNEDTFT